MNEYRVTVVLKNEFEKRSRIASYKCDCFSEAIDLAIAFDMHPETISIRVDEIKQLETDISDLFSKLDKIDIRERNYEE